MSTPERQSLLREVFREHRGPLYQYLRRRLASEHDAQELAQEVFLRLLRVTRVDLVVDPQAYLYRIARNLLYERSSKRLPAGSWVSDSELDDLAASRGDPEVEAEHRSINETLQLLLAELPPRDRSILLLFCHEGLSQREIAERVGLSKSMVQKLLAQSLAECRKRMRRLPAPGRKEFRP